MKLGQDVFYGLNHTDDKSRIDACLESFVSIIDDVCKSLFEKLYQNTAFV